MYVNGWRGASESIEHEGPSDNGYEGASGASMSNEPRAAWS